MRRERISSEREIILIFADSSLEIIPKHLAKFLGRKRKVRKESIILNSFWHYRILHRLKNYEKRGRPDILHSALLLTQDSILNKSRILRVIIHTIDDKVIYVNNSWRPPRHYLRFLGLMEQLFESGQVPPESDNPLLKLINKSLKETLNEISPEMVIGFSRRGKKNMRFLRSILERHKKVALIIGAFPKGFFSNEVLGLIDELIKISDHSLSTLYVTARVIVTIENTLKLVD